MKAIFSAVDPVQLDRYSSVEGFLENLKRRQSAANEAFGSRALLAWPQLPRLDICERLGVTADGIRFINTLWEQLGREEGFGALIVGTFATGDTHPETERLGWLRSQLQPELIVEEVDRGAEPLAFGRNRRREEVKLYPFVRFWRVLSDGTLERCQPFAE